MHGCFPKEWKRLGKVIVLAAVAIFYYVVILPSNPDVSAAQVNVPMPGPAIETLMHTELPEKSNASEKIFFDNYSTETDSTRQNIDLTLQVDWPVWCNRSDGIFQPYSVEFVLESYFSGGRWYVCRKNHTIPGRPRVPMVKRKTCTSISVNICAFRPCGRRGSLPFTSRW